MRIAEYDGEPVAFMITLPDINELTARPRRPPVPVRLGEIAVAAEEAADVRRRGCR